MVVAAGAVPAMGHTEMDPIAAERAVAKGARITTHLFDAMGAWTGAHWKGGVQQDSAALIALAIPGIYYELICDRRGIQVPPYCAKMALRTAGEDKIILVTDCVSRVSHNPADYPEDDRRSAPDLNFNETGGLSGSRLVLAGACRNFIRYAGGDVRTAFKCASTNPAKALGLDHKIGTIHPGKDANVLLVDEKFNVRKVIFHGEEI
jgi:N-acetylglucosamine-6-phosphate deacetylase